MNKYGKLPNTAQSIKLETYMKDWKIYLSLSALNYERHSFFNFKVIKKNGFRNLKLIMIDIFFSFSCTFQVFHFWQYCKLWRPFRTKHSKSYLFICFWQCFEAFFTASHICDVTIKQTCVLHRFVIPVPIWNPSCRDLKSLPRFVIFCPDFKSLRLTLFLISFAPIRSP